MTVGTDTKALRTRIKSVDSTLHLTKAMGLVASSKIRRATDMMNKGREYSQGVSDVINVLTACPECAKSTYMQVREGKTRIIVIAGDRGLAGGYNANVFRLADALRESAEMIPIGKRACERYGKDSVSSEKFGYDDAKHLAEILCADFRDGKFSRLGIISTKYVSMMMQTAQTEYILPLEKSQSAKTAQVIFEPDEAEVFDKAVPEYVAGKILAAVRESFNSEVTARHMAMDSAGKNAQQMIDDLQLEYNRARQSAITQEITEIVAGSGT